MKKFLNALKKIGKFIAKLFAPKFSIFFITPTGVKIRVTSNHGTEDDFRAAVNAIFYFLDDSYILPDIEVHSPIEEEKEKPIEEVKSSEEVEVKKSISQPTSNIIRGMFYE